MSAVASQITSVSIVCSASYLGADQRKPQSPVSLAFVRGFHWWSVDSPHKGPVTRKMLSFDDVIMIRPIAYILTTCFQISSPSRLRNSGFIAFPMLWNVTKILQNRLLKICSHWNHTSAMWRLKSPAILRRYGPLNYGESVSSLWHHYDKKKN